MQSKHGIAPSFFIQEPNMIPVNMNKWLLFLEGVIMSVIYQNRIGVYGYEYNYKKTS